MSTAAGMPKWLLWVLLCPVGYLLLGKILSSFLPDGILKGALLLGGSAGIFWKYGGKITFRKEHFLTLGSYSIITGICMGESMLLLQKVHTFETQRGAGVGLLICAACAEELIYRGIVFEHAKDGLSIKAALILSALLFGAGHASDPVQIFCAVAAGLIWAGLSLEGSLFFPIISHASANITIYLLRTGSVAVLLMGILFLICLRKKAELKWRCL